MPLATNAPAISEAESAVMNLLWAQHPQSATDLASQLQTERGWAETTVKTLLNRLLNKGAVTVEAQGRKYLYAPALPRSAWVQSESQSLLGRLFGGRVAPLVAHMGERGALSEADLADIKAVIAQMEAQAAQSADGKPA